MHYASRVAVVAFGFVFGAALSVGAPQEIRPPNNVDTPWELESWCRRPESQAATACLESERSAFVERFCADHPRTLVYCQNYLRGQEVQEQEQAPASDTVTARAREIEQQLAREQSRRDQLAREEESVEAARRSETSLQQQRQENGPASVRAEAANNTENTPQEVPFAGSERGQESDGGRAGNLLLALVGVALVMALGFGIFLFLRRGRPARPQEALAPRSNLPDSGRQTFFISHASADEARARRLVAAIEAAGQRCWVAPRDIRAGASYAESITHGIEACSVFVVLVSQASNASPPVLNEVELARRFNRVLVPVILDRVEMSKALLYYLSAAQWVTHSGNDAATAERVIAAHHA